MFIINPISGIGRQKKIQRLIETHPAAKHHDFEIAYTEAAGHAVELAREAASAGYDIVVAVGGDGSINEVARGLIGTQTAAGIIPAGSGNGLAHFLKIPFRARAAIDCVLTGKTKRIDTASINDQVFVSLAGVGFDAYVADKFSRSKTRGLLAYARVIAREYMLFRSKRYKLYLNGKALKRRAFMITFANSNQFGFNAKMAPQASVTDGLLDVCIMKKPPVYMALFILPLLFWGLIDRTPFSEIIKTTEVRMIQRKNFVVHIDGDQIILGKELHIKINPLSLNIVTP
jgi:diacylglycerol kinase (ATP)